MLDKLRNAGHRIADAYNQYSIYAARQLHDIVTNHPLAVRAAAIALPLVAGLAYTGVHALAEQVGVQLDGIVQIIMPGLTPEGLTVWGYNQSGGLDRLTSGVHQNPDGLDVILRDNQNDAYVNYHLIANGQGVDVSDADLANGTKVIDTTVAARQAEEINSLNRSNDLLSYTAIAGIAGIVTIVVGAAIASRRK